MEFEDFKNNWILGKLDYSNHEYLKKQLKELKNVPAIPANIIKQLKTNPVYRCGHDIENKTKDFGLSWTLSKETALWFLKRNKNQEKNMMLYTAYVNLENVFLYNNERKEEEIVCIIECDNVKAEYIVEADNRDDETALEEKQFYIIKKAVDVFEEEICKESCRRCKKAKNSFDIDKDEYNNNVKLLYKSCDNMILIASKKSMDILFELENSGMFGYVKSGMKIVYNYELINISSFQAVRIKYKNGQIKISINLMREEDFDKLDDAKFKKMKIAFGDSDYILNSYR